VSATKPVPLSPAAAQFYVLKDNAALSGIDLTHPSQSTDQVGTPTVNFGFTSTGANKFQQCHADDRASGSDRRWIG